MDDEPATPFVWSLVAVGMICLIAIVVIVTHQRTLVIKHSRCYLQQTCGETNDGKPIQFSPARK